MTRPARILIAEQGLTRLGVRAALEEDDTLEVCAEASDAEETIREAKRTQPDVCLVGWDIPSGGITAVQGVFDVSPSSAVVVLTSTSDIDDLLSALRAGAIGYVPGGASSEGLRRVVRAALSHEAVVPRSMVRDLILELRARKRRRGHVTSREAQVLALLRQGNSTEEMARRLRISPVTVRRHLSDLVHKLGVESRAALMQPDRAEQPPGKHCGVRSGSTPGNVMRCCA